jgi:hypothetical protein
MLKYVADVLTCDAGLVRWLMSNPVDNRDASGFMWLRDAGGRRCRWLVVPGPDMKSLR